MISKQSYQMFFLRKLGHSVLPVAANWASIMVHSLRFASSSKLGLHHGSFSFAKWLRSLDFSDCSGILLPDSIGQVKQLKCLIAPKVQNERLPQSIVVLSKLQYLDMHGSSLISALPKSIGKLGSLVYLDLSGCSNISELLKSFGDLRKMVHLDTSGCSLIRQLLCSLGNLTNLQHLDLSECSNVEEIPGSLCTLTQLLYLNLSSCSCLERIPEAVGSHMDLQYLNISNCRCIRELPESFTNLRNLLHLDMKSCQIEKGLPGALHGLFALQYLDMSDFLAYLEDGSLHDAMRNVHNLKYLGLSQGSIRSPFGDDIEESGGCIDFIGTLTNLEHLDLSYNDELTNLPESVGNLKKLHTLNLSNCYWLKSVPDSISRITLKSLLIEGCSNELTDQASSLLHYSLALPFFKVRADGACSNLPLLEGANVCELRIVSLENVRFMEEARKVKLLDKSNLSTLTLAWTLRANRVLDDKNVLGQLEPPRGLKALCLKGYSTPGFPSWLTGISHHLPNLVHITLDALRTCSDLPPLGQLVNLERLHIENCPRVTKIDKNFCGGKGAFGELSKFSLYDMEGLDEWITIYSVENGVEFMFPMLDELAIEGCPRLRLKPCPPTFRKCTIERSDLVIYSLEMVDRNDRRTYSAPSTKLRIRISDNSVWGYFTTSLPSKS
jgi:Leucine-rich repeat (LRR) protein